MTCYSPMRLYPIKGHVGYLGKVRYGGFKTSDNGRGGIPIPCGKCTGCYLERARQWAVRCYCESQIHDENCFITLTYDDHNLKFGAADHGILYPPDLTNFWKRLRNHFGPGIKYFACGEYGDSTNRPHYHALIFGADFQDKKLYTTKNDNQIYTSDTLNDIWTHGDCYIGNVTLQSASYVARYVLKKSHGMSNDDMVKKGITPEFTRMSRRPGIGHSWLDKYEQSVFPHGYVVLPNGSKSGIPKYFNKRYELTHPIEYEDLRLQKVEIVKENYLEFEIGRLKAKAKVKQAQIQSLVRPDN